MYMCVHDSWIEFIVSSVSTLNVSKQNELQKKEDEEKNKMTKKTSIPCSCIYIDIL